MTPSVSFGQALRDTSPSSATREGEAGLDQGVTKGISQMTFLREKYPYLLGFAVIEAGIYFFNGPTGNFTTGFLGLFAIWIIYAATNPH
jgi:hypothetical protein